jgi:peptidyl-prolyl cis-trans isomerase SurA
MFRRISHALPLLLLLLPALGHGAPARRTGRKGVVDGLAAQVDTVSILRSEVEDQARLFASQGNVDLKDPQVARKLKNDVLDRLVEEKVVAAEAHRQNIQVPDADVDQQVEQALQTARQSLGSEDAFQEQLRREHLTEEKLRKKYTGDFRTQLMAQKLVQKEIQTKVSADTNDARAYYALHKGELRPRPDVYHLSAILIRFQAGDSVKARAQQKAQGVLSRVSAGEDFGKLATLFSDDPSARDEGRLPWFSRGDFDSTFTKAAFALKPGETSGIVETRFGYHIIRVDSVDAGRIKARHILILVVPDPADSATTQQRATLVHTRAEAHEDFSKLAEQFSDDVESRTHGGSLEPNDSASLARVFPPPIVQTILTMVPTSISPVLSMSGGLVILKLDEKEPSRPYHYDEIVQDLTGMARQEKLKTAYDKWVAELKKKHRVTVHYF